MRRVCVAIIPVLLLVPIVGSGGLTRSPFASVFPANITVAASLRDVSGTISEDTIWTSIDSPYVVVGDVTVAPEATLTIQPGVEVRFDGVYALTVRGQLLAEGLPGEEIVFTSNQASPAPGDWGVLDFRTDSNPSHLQHVIIEYGGNASKMGWYCAAGAVCANTSSLMIEESIVRHSATRGVVLSQSSASLVNNTFERIAEEAIRLHACDLNVGECHPVIAGNSFDQTLAPILHAAPLNPILSGNQATNNETNGYVFQILCAVQGDNTWYADDLPYVISAGGNWCDISSSFPTTITIQPGTVVKLANALAFHQRTVVTATGTADTPIVFTSLKDDSFGGDTNNDGDASSPAPRDWGMVGHFGAQVVGTYEHVVFRYGGGSQASYGPIVSAEAGAEVVVRRSEISQSGGAGVRVKDTSSLTLAESDLSDHRDTGIEVNSTGDVLLENNRIQNCPSGVLANSGAPTIRGNFFMGNDYGVDVRASTAAPAVSPHNRFVGEGQMAIWNRHPMDQCIDAQFNWWGDVSGPEDTSTATDACELLDNAEGTGAPVSDGVNYTLWEGGTGRPVIAWPRCGVTARTQPRFTGWAAAGSTVLFYDDDTLIGQTAAGADNAFEWIPSTPLADGEHVLSAVAEAGGETSLATPILPLEVDSSLPFDPMGVLVSYDMHGRTYTQRMRDENGCATLAGALDMPLWVRPGTDLTVTVPMRSAFLPTLTEQAESSTLGIPEPAQPVNPASVLAPDAPLETVTLENDSSHTVTEVRVATSINTSLFTKFGAGVPLDNMSPEDIRAIDLPAGYYDLAFYSGTGTVVYRRKVQVTGGGSNVCDIQDADLSELVIENDTGRDFTEMYIKKDIYHIGGDFVSASAPVRDGQTVRLKYPTIDSGLGLLVLKSSDGAYYMRSPALHGHTRFQFTGKDPATSVTLNYGGSDKLCRLMLYRYPDSDATRGATPWLPGGKVNLLWLMDKGTLSGGESLSFKLEPGAYHIEADDCEGNTIGRWQHAEIRGLSKTINVVTPCTPPGRLRAGEGELQRLVTSSTNLQCGEDIHGFSTCSATAPVSASKLTLDMCYDPSDGEGGVGWELVVGAMIIDPDGYVYDASSGLDAKVSGATVTCDVYDEDYQAWSPWPAAFYENQVNPQVTAGDGYYAFFVPPGLYRVHASAPGYEDHVSPDIRVVSEIVHYNVPLQPTDRYARVYLPLILR